MKSRPQGALYEVSNPGSRPGVEEKDTMVLPRAEQKQHKPSDAKKVSNSKN